jgi:hypothetical protein
VNAELIEAMVKTYSLYEAATGLFTGKRLHCDDEGLLAVRLPAGTLAREGAYDHRSQRLDLSTGHVVAYRPPAPSGDHEWDSIGKRWQVKAAVRGAEGRTAVIYARIQALEATQGRAVREATLGDASAMKRLKEIDAEINDLRRELARS